MTASERPMDPETAVADFIDRLEHSHGIALPEGVIPPEDQDVLEQARASAKAAAKVGGLTEAMARGQRTMAEWTLNQYQRAGFDAAYFGGSLDAPERRHEVVDVMVDAATAYALAGLLSDETTATLLARFEESHPGVTG